MATGTSQTREIDRRANQMYAGGAEKMELIGPSGDLRERLKKLKKRSRKIVSSDFANDFKSEDIEHKSRFYDSFGENDLLGLPSFNHQYVLQQLALQQECFDMANARDREEYKQIMIKAASSDPRSEIYQEFANYREFELRADLLPSPWSMQAFQSVNLSADETPMFVKPQSFLHNTFNVQSVGDHGEPRQEQWKYVRDAYSQEIDRLATDKVEYSIWDLQSGYIDESQDINTKLQFDMEQKIDSLALANIDAAETASGLQDIMHIHPRIDVNNIPDSNYLDLSSADTGIITIAKIKNILYHIALFSAQTYYDGPLMMTAMMISPQNIRDPWDFTNLTSSWDYSNSTTNTDGNPLNTVPSSVRDSIFSTGNFVSAWGFNFNWQPNAMISKGRMYVLTNKPLGWHFTKSEFDKTYTYNGANVPILAEQNREQVVYYKTTKFYVPDEFKHHILIVDF